MTGAFLVMFYNTISGYIFTFLGVLLLAGGQVSFSYAQSDPIPAEIDPRLIEIVEEVKVRAIASQPTELRRSETAPSKTGVAELRIQRASRLNEASFSQNPKKIRLAIQDFTVNNPSDAAPSMGRVIDLFERHADLLESGANEMAYQKNAAQFAETGSWLEKFFAIQLSKQLYIDAGERQAAFQKAQYAFQIIPDDPNQQVYTQYAKAETLSTLAQLHNIQGNVDFAIANSLAYLKETDVDADAKPAIDILNNLIFSHSVKRDHEALLYLSEKLLEIETISTSSVPGLSEFRVSQAANMAGDFEKGLEHANLAEAVSQHAQINRQIATNKAIALAGLGRKIDARNHAAKAGINIESDHLLMDESGRDVLYLGFLLAQGTDDTLATQLYNRQLDVTAQKFLANTSRDTTAMVAELENSRERQAERDAAAAREAALQAETIDRQGKLNRALIFLSLLLGGAALGSFLFMKSRVKLLHKLEIKTVEAASAEKLKTEFLGMISHELRTPLNGIIGISDYLSNYHEDPDIRNKTGIVLRSGNELLSVVESLTDMARLDAGQLALSPHDAHLSQSLAAVPQNWIDPAKEKGLTFTHFVDPIIGAHHVDEGRLIQCLNILLENAVRFTNSGRVHLHITGHETDGAGVNRLTAIVADTGQGMSELVQSRLFTPFMQADTSRKRNHMGTGLNLAIAYALAEMMGGSLSVVSREGRGSEFKLDIPLGVVSAKSVERPLNDTQPVPIILDGPALENQPSESGAFEGDDEPQAAVIDLMQPHAAFPSLHDVEALVLPTPQEGQQHILVVDDMASNRDILRLILETQGHRCGEAEDGLSALAAMERQSFDLVVLDIHMAPMDGIETLRRIRASGTPYANIPVIALTADNAASTNAACMEVGADLFLTKPVRRDELLRAISYLNQTETPRALSQ